MRIDKCSRISIKGFVSVSLLEKRQLKKNKKFKSGATFLKSYKTNMSTTTINNINKQ